MHALPTAALVLGLLLAWELVVRLEHVPAFVLPPPSAVGSRWLANPLFFLTEGGISLAEALGGLLVGGLVGLVAGVLMARLR